MGIGLMSVLVGVANMVGGWFTMSPLFTRERLEQWMALGAGFLLGGALLTMLPEAFHSSPEGPAYVGLGFLGLFLVRRILSRGKRPAGPSPESAWAAVLGMGLHSFFDGAALGAASAADQHLGLLAFLAVLLHKLPEGFSLSALVVAGTGSRRLALIATALTGMATIGGALLAFRWADVAQLSHGALLGLAGGSFLYVGSVDMLPGLPGTWRNTWLVVVGAVMVYLLAGGVGHGHVH